MAFDMYLKISGPDLLGESKTTGFENQIEVLNFGFGVENAATLGSGATGITTGKAVPSDVSMLLRYSQASPPLFTALLSGQHYDQAELSLVKAGQSTPFLVHKLTDLVVTEYQTSATVGGDEGPVDSVSFIFAQITTRYSVQNAQGQYTPAGQASWDFTANRA